MNKYLEEGKKVLLFLDELNRCEQAVQQELMNLILNREINGYKIPEEVFLVAAMNPSSANEGFEGNSNYGVTDMDAASKNRLVWLRLELDSRSWLDWATEPVEANQDVEELDLNLLDKTKYETAIDNDIIEFIASFPDMLNIEREDTDASPSGRTWEFASDIIRTYRLNKGIFNEMHLEECIKGCVGFEAYTSFMTFLNNNSNPLLKPEELFAGKTLDKNLFEKLQDDTVPRQVIICKNVIRYVVNLEDKKQTKEVLDRMCKVLSVLPADMLITVMRYMRTSFTPFFDKMKRNSSFLALYRESTKIL